MGKVIGRYVFNIDTRTIYTDERCLSKEETEVRKITISAIRKGSSLILRHFSIALFSSLTTRSGITKSILDSSIYKNKEVYTWPHYGIWTIDNFIKKYTRNMSEMYSYTYRIEQTVALESKRELLEILKMKRELSQYR